MRSFSGAVVGLLAVSIAVRVSADTHPASTAVARLDGLESDIASLVEKYDAPGLAVAVIEDEEIIYSLYRGKRDLASARDVTAATQFGIGSVVKSFTSGLIGTMVARGEVSLDGHPRTYLADFPTSGRFNDDRLTVSHLLSHTSGLPSMDGSLAFFPPVERAEIVPRMSPFPPDCAPADCWSYNNLNFILLDAVAESATGESKATLMRDRLLSKAGMENSLATTSAFARSSNAATGYAMVEGVPQATATENLLGEQIYATAPDLARWIGVWLNEGRAGDAQVLPRDYVIRATSMHAIDDGRPPAADSPGVYLFGYGHGWFVKSVDGDYVVHHGGNENGFSTHVLFVPARGFGVVALTNQQNSILPNLVTDTIMRRMAGMDVLPVDAYPLSVRDAQKLLPGDEVKLSIIRDEPLGVPVDALVGEYAAAGYGKASIVFSDDVLTLDTPLARFTLVHEGEKTFRIASTSPVPAGVNLDFFRVMFVGEDEIDSFTFNIADEPVVFDRVAR